MSNKQERGVFFSGNALRAMRKKRGMTLQALADKVCSSKSYIWELENVKTLDPSFCFVFALAKALRCNTKAFVRTK